jgi:TRAP-type mannitol/chloroaromatic compound transport system permease small subunit
MIRFLDKFETGIARIGLVLAIILLPLIMSARVFEVVARNLNLPGSLFNAAEGELFVLFAFLTIASAYVSGAHVRVDIFRDRFGPKIRALIELAGGLLLVLPFCLVVVWYGAIIVETTWAHGERAAVALGGQLRWMIVASIPVGVGMLGLAVISRMIREAAFLLGLSQTTGKVIVE